MAVSGGNASRRSHPAPRWAWGHRQSGRRAAWRQHTGHRERRVETTGQQRVPVNIGSEMPGSCRPGTVWQPVGLSRKSPIFGVLCLEYGAKHNIISCAPEIVNDYCVNALSPTGCQCRKTHSRKHRKTLQTATLRLRAKGCLMPDATIATTIKACSNESSIWSDHAIMVGSRCWATRWPSAGARISWREPQRERRVG
jgi:hypothetical protein